MSKEQETLEVEEQILAELESETISKLKARIISHSIRNNSTVLFYTINVIHCDEPVGVFKFNSNKVDTTSLVSFIQWFLNITKRIGLKDLLCIPHHVTDIKDYIKTKSKSSNTNIAGRGKKADASIIDRDSSLKTLKDISSRFRADIKIDGDTGMVEIFDDNKLKIATRIYDCSIGELAKSVEKLLMLSKEIS